MSRIPPTSTLCRRLQNTIAREMRHQSQISKHLPEVAKKVDELSQKIFPRS